VKAVSDVIDLSQYSKRIQDALPGDPYQAIGATKDMLEATMRTVLRRRGIAEVEKFDFPALATRCLTELGLTSTTPPATKGERHLRKIASSAKTMIETANELRNLAGTGHGRVIGEEEAVSAADASLVASCGLVLAAWLLRRGNERS
jgi:Abortive infection C-terminus